MLTGISGFDEILNGRIPKHNVVLLAGGSGTGKSIFGYQYLFNGLIRNQPGVLIALEEHPVQIRLSMAQFGRDIVPYEERGKFTMVDAFTAGIGEAAKREKYVVRAPMTSKCL